MMRLARSIHRGLSGEKAFTLVELLIVMIISTILLAGMIGLVEMSMRQFNRSKQINAVSDSARRALTSMGRQVRTALHFDDAQCSSTQVSFYADIDSDDPDSDVDAYTNAEYVRFYLQNGDLVQMTTQPAADGGATTFVSLCENVYALSFHYFGKGVKPIYNPGSGLYTNETTSNYNADVGMVKPIIEFRRGMINHKYEQDIFLRVLQRSD